MSSRALVLALACLSIDLPARGQSTRDVTYDARAVVPVNAKLRFTTMIILPDQEEILDFVCGDKDFWIVSGSQNLAYVKPAKAGATTNLNLVTATGRVYSFLLNEGSTNPDLKVYVLPDPSMRTAPGTRKFYSAAEVEELRRTATEARNAAEEARSTAAKTVEERVNAFRASFPTRLQFPYRFKANEKPFDVSAIYTDGTFTYIRSGATELPSLYEIRDDAPNLTNFQVQNGVYIVPKVLERGYLAIGKQRLPFEMRR
jgi:type IV secretory pathway VirB9-like protein